MPAIETFVVLIIRTSDSEGALTITLSIVLGEIMSEPSLNAGIECISLLSYSHTHFPIFYSSYNTGRRRLDLLGT